MSIQITHVRYFGDEKTYEATTHYRWRVVESGEISSSDRSSLVQWVDMMGIAFVGDGEQRVGVDAFHIGGTPGFLRTYADNQWTDVLLDLPTF